MTFADVNRVRNARFTRKKIEAKSFFIKEVIMASFFWHSLVYIVPLRRFLLLPIEDVTRITT